MAQNVRLGIFILLTLAILATGIFLIGDKQARWQKTYVAKAQFDNVSGLAEGAEVRLGGIRKGSVQSIQLPSDPKGKVTVVMTLGEETRQIVRIDSRAMIKSEGLLGDKFVEISFGTPEAHRLQGGETLTSVPAVDISDIVAKADGVMESAKGAVDHVQAAAENISSITAKVNTGQGTAGALVNDKTMYREATASAAAMHDDLEALKSNFLLRGFFNKRGYVDSTELQKHELRTLPTKSPDKTFTFDPRQLFDKADSAKLKNKKALDEIGAYLQNQKFQLTVAISSGGPKGDSEKMLVLTQAQSTVIRNYLVQNFRLDDARIRMRGLGKSNSAATIQVRIYAEIQERLEEKNR